MLAQKGGVVAPTVGDMLRTVSVPRVLARTSQTIGATEATKDHTLTLLRDHVQCTKICSWPSGPSWGWEPGNVMQLQPQVPPIVRIPNLTAMTLYTQCQFLQLLLDLMSASLHPRQIRLPRLLMQILPSLLLQPIVHR